MYLEYTLVKLNRDPSRVTHGFVMWELAPGCNSIKNLSSVTIPPTLSHPPFTLILQQWISSPTSGFTVRRFFYSCFLPIFFSMRCLFSLVDIRLNKFLWHYFLELPTKEPIFTGNLSFFLILEMFVLLILPH
jgi:hypothetical protein